MLAPPKGNAALKKGKTEGELLPVQADSTFPRTENKGTKQYNWSKNIPKQLVTHKPIEKGTAALANQFPTLNNIRKHKSISSSRQHYEPNVEKLL